jgi:hypothetical protein
MGSRNWKGGQGPTKGCRAIIILIIICTGQKEQRQRKHRRKIICKRYKRRERRTQNATGGLPERTKKRNEWLETDTNRRRGNSARGRGQWIGPGSNKTGIQNVADVSWSPKETLRWREHRAQRRRGDPSPTEVWRIQFLDSVSPRVWCRGRPHRLDSVVESHASTFHSPGESCRRLTQCPRRSEVRGCGRGAEGPPRRLPADGGLSVTAQSLCVTRTCSRVAFLLEKAKTKIRQFLN